MRRLLIGLFFLSAVGVSIVEAGAEETDSEPRHPTRESEDGVPAVPLKGILFPAGDVFHPLIADPKQPQFFVSFRTYHTRDDTSNVAAVGFGESFGLYRLPGKEQGDGVQVSVAAALFAQFDLDAPSSDLVNADYTIGFPVTWRRGPYSARLRIYHQSSHLGDEFLLRARPARVNLSYEAVDLIASREWGQWRGYLGGEYLIRREPSDLKPASAHAGVEYRGATTYLGIGRLVGGVDVKSFQEHDWAVDTSLKLGVEIGRPGPGGRRVQIMAEGFRGHSPHGQFYTDRISYYGLGLYLGF